MERKGLSPVVIIMVLALIIVVASAPAAEEKPRETAVSTGVEDQTGVAMTIYNVNLGLVWRP